MKYSIGQSLADYGFKFYEKLHEPIFLINKLGKVVKANEAGRKLANIAKISIDEIERLITENLLSNLLDKATQRILLKAGNLNLQVIASRLTESDFVLVEIHHHNPHQERRIEVPKTHRRTRRDW